MPKLPTAADVGGVSARQTGQGEPNIVRTDERAFQSPLGVAAGQLQPAAQTLANAFTARDQRLAAAQAKIQRRNNALDRLRLRRQVRGQLDEVFAQAKSADLSLPGALQQHGQTGRDVIDAAVEEHVAGGADADSVLKFRESLETDFGSFVDDAAQEAATIHDTRVADEQQRIKSEMAGAILSGQQPGEALANAMSQFAPGTELAEAMREGGDVKLTREMHALSVMSTFESLFQNPSPENMNAIIDGLDMPEVQAVIPPKEQIALRKRHAAATNDTLHPPEEVLRLDEHGNDIPGSAVLVPRSQSFGRTPIPKRPVAEVKIDGAGRAGLEAIAKREEKTVDRVTTRAEVARRQIPTIKRQRDIIERGEFVTGTASGLRKFMAQVGEFVNAPPNVMDRIGNAADAEAFDAASAQLSIEVANKLSRVTNLSLQLIRDSFPKLSLTPTGNLIILDALERGARREIEHDQILTDMVREWKEGDAGTVLRPVGRDSFQERLDALEEDDPVWSKEIDEQIRAEISKVDNAGVSFQSAVSQKPEKDRPLVTTLEELNALSPGDEYRVPPKTLMPDGRRSKAGDIFTRGGKVEKSEETE